MENHKDQKDEVFSVFFVFLSELCVPINAQSLA